MKIKNINTLVHDNGHPCSLDEAKKFIAEHAALVAKLAAYERVAEAAEAVRFHFDHGITESPSRRVRQELKNALAALAAARNQ